MKINSIKQLEQQKLEAENIWHPKINDRSKKLLEKKNSVSGDVYNRLYD